MKKEVSCRVVQGMLEYARERGIAPETILAGMPYPHEYLTDKRNRIEWDVYCTMTANARQIWSDEDFVRMGSDIMKSVPFQVMSSVLRLLFTGPEIYFWTTKGANSPGSQLFSCITSEIELVGKNHVLLTPTLAPGHQYCREFFLITKGSLIAGTAVIGLGPAQVEMRETERGAIYDIICPEGGGALSWLRRAIMWPFAARAAARELRDANESLHQRYAQLEEAQEKVQRQATQLKVTYDVSRLIHSNLDLASTLKAIARSLVAVAGFSAAALSLDTLVEEEEVKRIVKDGVEVPGSERLMRVLKGHGVKYGEVTLWTQPGSNVQEAEELLDYIIPTISMEIDDALSFKMIDDYRNTLQQKVDERTRELKETNEALKKVQVARDRFFSNISHEFRTPLTLILGPVKQIAEQTEDEKTREELGIVHRNARRLLELVNQLLDMAKIESGNMTLRASRRNIVPLVKALLVSFAPYAERKNITLKFSTTEEEIVAYLDREKVESIVTNVLSNAFKFTPDGGKIEVSLRGPKGRSNLKTGDQIASSLRNAPRNDGTGDGYIELSVSDTGIGIPQEKIPRVFDRFYEVDGGHPRPGEGTGIGLALTKELIELHKGTILVESVEGKGTVVTIRFPLGKEHLKPEELLEGTGSEEEVTVPEPVLGAEDRVVKLGVDLGATSDQPIVLLVEDNAEVRSYVKGILDNHYTLLEAADGEDGWNKSVEHIPDVIISDVMMPRMDGFALCAKLKTDERTSHIPVILLTAKAGSENKIQGFETGADDYMTKPFEPEELKARIRNLIEQRMRIHEHFRKNGIPGFDDAKIMSIDKKFLQRVFHIITENLSSTAFGVESLAEMAAVSRSVLHRKIVSLTGEPPVELIRRIRLTRAAELIEKKFGNLSEIALEVGFTNPSYFSECFKKQFGVAPSHYPQ